jgi:tRNA(Ile)-lysidine synthase
VEDSSNTSVKYARNKIRLEITPKLKELNPGLEQTFKNNLQHFKNLELLLNQRVEGLKQELFVACGDEIIIDIERVKQLEPKHLLLFNLLKDFGFNETVIDDLIQALDKHSGRRFESPGFNLVCDREKLIISKKSNTQLNPVIINLNDHRVHYGNYTLTVLHDDSPLVVKNNPMGLSVDRGLLVYPLTLRAWKSGDFFYPIGMKNRKKLSDFFISQKIPLPSKSGIPILVNGNGEIIWVGGLRPDERYKVTNNTKKVTIFELTKL